MIAQSSSLVFKTPRPNTCPHTGKCYSLIVFRILPLEWRPFPSSKTSLGVVAPAFSLPVAIGAVGFPGRVKQSGLAYEYARVAGGRPSRDTRWAGTFNRYDDFTLASKYRQGLPS